MKLIDNLQVFTKVHPNPYTLQWLKQGSEVNVSKQALIYFSIRPYCGEVLCDVFPMDASHIFLGRPWLFDNQVIHDGHVNIYTFKFKGRNLTLAPFTTPKPHTFKLRRRSEKSLYMSKTSVDKAISKSKPLFALLLVESNKSEVVKPVHPLTHSFTLETV